MVFHSDPVCGFLLMLVEIRPQIVQCHYIFSPKCISKFGQRQIQHELSVYPYSQGEEFKFYQTGHVSTYWRTTILTNWEGKLGVRNTHLFRSTSKMLQLEVPSPKFPVWLSRLSEQKWANFLLAPWLLGNFGPFPNVRYDHFWSGVSGRILYS